MSCFHPISCFLVANKGYVWDAEGAMTLRKKCRIMGSLLGGVSQFKNQNEVNSLPFELTPDEITLALENGWINLFKGTYEPLAKTFQKVLEMFNLKSKENNGYENGDMKASSTDSPFFSVEDLVLYESYYKFFDAATGSYVGERTLSDLLNSSQNKRHRRCSLISSNNDNLASSASTSQPENSKDSAENSAILKGKSLVLDSQKKLKIDLSEPLWRAAIGSGSLFTLPITAAAAATARGETTEGTLDPNSTGSFPSSINNSNDNFGSKTTSTTSRVSGDEWKYPQTPSEILRYSVFRDLHEKGFMMSGGSKFGSDLLAYPGDPSLYHAQFTVRLILPGTPLNPMLLKAAGRGSHAARKHLLLATLPLEDSNAGERGKGGKQRGEEETGGKEEEEKGEIKNLIKQTKKKRTMPTPFYISIAPEAGFGSKA